jgi:hypothetical protein
VGRELQQAKVTVVTTAEELRAAVDAGEPHIELQEHIDLTKLPRTDAEYNLGIIPRQVLSMRVRITHPNEML